MQQFRMLALISRAAIAVGVALCVTPIFASAQSNDAAGMFNEIQAMRQEIAELRDMIERQEFELRKLKRAQQSPAGSAAAPVYGAPAPSQQPVANQSPPVFGEPGAVVIGQSQTAAPTTVTAPADDESFYRPYPEQGQAPTVAGAQQGAPVTSTVITAPSTPTQDTGYPPVVERSVSTGPSSAAPVSTQYPRASNSGSADEYSVRQIQQAVPPAEIEAATQGSTVTATATTATTTAGVIAIPNAVPPLQAGSVTPQVSAQTAPSQAPATGTVNPGDLASAPMPQVAPAAPALSETDFYQQGFNLLKQSKHAEAVTVFEQQIAAYPQGEYADDAYYWIAESMYVNRNLEVSKRNFKAIINNYKQSTRLPDAMLKTAYIEQEQGNQIEARILLQEIVQFHPRSNAAISAKNRLAEMVN